MSFCHQCFFRPNILAQVFINETYVYPRFYPYFHQLQWSPLILQNYCLFFSFMMLKLTYDLPLVEVVVVAYRGGDSGSHWRIQNLYQYWEKVSMKMMRWDARIAKRNKFGSLVEKKYQLWIAHHDIMGIKRSSYCYIIHLRIASLYVS